MLGSRLHARITCLLCLAASQFHAHLCIPVKSLGCSLIFLLQVVLSPFSGSPQVLSPWILSTPADFDPLVSIFFRSFCFHLLSVSVKLYQLILTRYWSRFSSQKSFVMSYFLLGKGQILGSVFKAPYKLDVFYVFCPLCADVLFSSTAKQTPCGVRHRGCLARHWVPSTVGAWHIPVRCLPSEWAGGWMSALISCLLPAFFFAFKKASLSVFCLTCFLGALFSPEMPQPVVDTETNSVYLLHYFNTTGSMKFSFHSDSAELKSFFFLMWTIFKVFIEFVTISFLF